MKLFAALCPIFLLSIAAVPTSSSPGTSLALTHVNVVDTARQTLLSDQTVVIISGASPLLRHQCAPARPKTPASSTVAANFSWPACGTCTFISQESAQIRSGASRCFYLLLLANGIIGVRDMGGDLESLLTWKREIESGTLLGPHIIASGPWLAGGGKKSPEQYPVASAEEARAAVRDLKGRGADFIKVISLPSRDAFFAVADECKKQSIQFAGHLPLEVSAVEASDAGMHSIEHFFYSSFSISLSSKEAELRQRLISAQQKGDSAAWEQISQEADATYSPEKAMSLFQALKKNGTWVTPTLASMDIASHPEKWSIEDPQLAFVPATLCQGMERFVEERTDEETGGLVRSANLKRLEVGWGTAPLRCSAHSSAPTHWTPSIFRVIACTKSSLSSFGLGTRPEKRCMPQRPERHVSSVARATLDRLPQASLRI